MRTKPDCNRPHPRENQALRLTNAHYARRRRRQELAATLRLVGLWWGLIPHCPDQREVCRG